jgi:hypothetical protein
VKQNFRFPWSAVLAIAVGFVVTLGYFIPSSAPVVGGTLASLGDYFLQVGVVLAAVAMLVGLINLAAVHWTRFRTAGENRLGSGVVVITMIATFLLGTIDYFWGWLEDPNRSLTQYVFRHIQLPVERSLMALLVVILTYMAIRMFRRRMTVYQAVFLGVFMVVLLGTGLDIPYITDTVKPWLSNVWAVAGTRGLLLGIGLGTLASGLRVLSGVDRPYGG